MSGKKRWFYGDELLDRWNVPAVELVDFVLNHGLPVYDPDDLNQIDLRAYNREGQEWSGAPVLRDTLVVKVFKRAEVLNFEKKHGLGQFQTERWDTDGVVGEEPRVLCDRSAGEGRKPSADLHLPVPRVPAGKNVFFRLGAVWFIRYNGKETHVKALDGLDYIAYLLSQPHTEVSCIDLMKAAGKGPPDGQSPPGGMAYDNEELKGILDKLKDLRAQRDKTREDNDLGLVERLEQEISEAEEFLHQKPSFFSPKLAGTQTENARINITGRIRTAISTIRKAHPALGEYMAKYIKTGNKCQFSPPSDSSPWSVSWED